MTNFQGNNYHRSAEKETALKTCVASVELGTVLHRFEMDSQNGSDRIPSVGSIFTVTNIWRTFTRLPTGRLRSMAIRKKGNRAESAMRRPF
jgi:hypothetical protein